MKDAFGLFGRIFSPFHTLERPFNFFEVGVGLAHLHILTSAIQRRLLNFKMYIHQPHATIAFLFHETFTHPCLNLLRGSEALDEFLSDGLLSEQPAGGWVAEQTGLNAPRVTSDVRPDLYTWNDMNELMPWGNHDCFETVI